MVRVCLAPGLCVEVEEEALPRVLRLAGVDLARLLEAAGLDLESVVRAALLRALGAGGRAGAGAPEAGGGRLPRLGSPWDELLESGELWRRSSRAAARYGVTRHSIEVLRRFARTLRGGGEVVARLVRGRYVFVVLRRGDGAYCAYRFSPDAAVARRLWRVDSREGLVGELLEGRIAPDRETAEALADAVLRHARPQGPARGGGGRRVDWRRVVYEAVWLRDPERIAERFGLDPGAAEVVARLVSARRSGAEVVETARDGDLTVVVLAAGGGYEVYAFGERGARRTAIPAGSPRERVLEELRGLGLGEALASRVAAAIEARAGSRAGRGGPPPVLEYDEEKRRRALERLKLEREAWRQR